MFFATQSGKNTDSALPLLNILEILTVTNVHCLHVLKFVHAWHKGILPELFNDFFQYAANQIFRVKQTLVNKSHLRPLVFGKKYHAGLKI